MSFNIDQDVKVFSAHKKYYVSDLIRIGDSFFDSVEILENNKGDKWASYLVAAGFMSSRSGECYLKALILSHGLNIKNYKKIRKCGHNLFKLLGLLLNYDISADKLKGAVEILDKYSGDKIAYPETIFEDIENNTPKLYGNDFIIVREIRDYVKNLLE